MDEMEISKDPRLMELLTQVGGMPPEDLLAAEAGTQQPVINQGDEIVELGDDFDYEGYPSFFAVNIAIKSDPFRVILPSMTWLALSLT